MFEEILHLNTNFTSIVRFASKKHAITLPQALILFYISQQGTSMSELAQYLGLDPSTITRNIEKLEKRNILYRERSTKDTRMIYVYKSAEGLKISNNIEQEAENILIQSAKDGVGVQNVIQKMNWNLEKSKSLK
tara:strand:+ start:443 stop:844 length:402 start_codon:yes stop_codon:yes gene_type:complete